MFLTVQHLEVALTDYTNPLKRKNIYKKHNQYSYKLKNHVIYIPLAFNKNFWNQMKNITIANHKLNILKTNIDSVIICALTKEYINIEIFSISFMFE